MSVLEGNGAVTFWEFMNTPVGLVIASFLGTALGVTVLLGGVEAILTAIHNRREARENADR